jgi:hypothetical protein
MKLNLNITQVFGELLEINYRIRLRYDTTNVTSASFEKSIEALRTAEHFNYFAALGIFPYTRQRRGIGTYDPIFDEGLNINVVRSEFSQFLS